MSKNLFETGGINYARIGFHRKNKPIQNWLWQNERRGKRETAERKGFQYKLSKSDNLSQLVV